MAEPITQEKLAAAIFKAKSKMQKAVKSSVNPHFRSQYADLGAVLDATIPALVEAELTIEQRTGFDQDGNYMLYTWFKHVSGASTRDDASIWPIIFAPDKPQVMGSSLTYGRRYQWGLVCGIASEIDDDGNKASTAQNGAPSKNASQVRKSGDYVEFEKQMRLVTSEEKLVEHWAKWMPVIQTWPEKHRETAKDEYERAKTRIAERADF